MLFRWEDIDHSLAESRLLELSIEMNQLIEADERRIRFEQRGNMNRNTVPSLLLKMQQDRANELAQKTYDIYCDVWQKQGNEKSADFLRAVFARGIRVALRARARSIASEFAMVAVRTAFPTALTQAHLRSLDLNMRRMEDRWCRRIEIEARECEHTDRIAKLRLATLTKEQPTCQKENSSELLGESNWQPRVESGQSVPALAARNRARPVSQTEVAMFPQPPVVSQSSPVAQTPVGLQATASASVENTQKRTIPAAKPGEIAVQPQRSEEALETGDLGNLSDEDVGKKRAADIVRAQREIAEVRGQMDCDVDYDRLKVKYPTFMLFKICDREPELKLLLLSIKGHHQRRALRFAKQVAASHNGIRLNTIEKAWDKYNPDKKTRPRRRTRLKA